MYRVENIYMSTKQYLFQSIYYVFGSMKTRMSVQTVCGEHMSCFYIVLSDESGGCMRYPYQKEWISTDRLNMFVVFITHYTSDVDLMNI